ELLRFANHRCLKEMHYVSTLGVFGGAAYRGQRGIEEQDEVDDPGGLPSGYTQSKWVAEHLVREAAKRGVPARIYRPGMILGDSLNGMCNLKGLLCRSVRACGELHSIPDLSGSTRPGAPVDFVAQALVHIASSPEFSWDGHTFHLILPEPLRLMEG